jgi:hypothetical protein
MNTVSKFLSLCALTFFSASIYAQKLDVIANGYPNHISLKWKANPSALKYNVKKSTDKIIFSQAALITDQYFQEFTDDSQYDKKYYIVEAYSAANQLISVSDTMLLEEKKFTDPELTDMVQEHTFQYFYDFAHPTSGMARERNTSEDIVTTGGTGFGIMAIIAGIENGYISRKEGLDQILKIASFLQFADKFHGVFPHWLNGKTGNVYPFSQYDDGGDLVETAFLMQGLLTARKYFDQETAEEKAIRKIATKLWEEVEWDWFTKNDSGSLYWHWSPANLWKINQPIRGYNEALIVYLLAIASPTHPIKASYWKSGWAKSGYKNGNNYYSTKLPLGPAYGGPLFFAHYSFLGFDPRYTKDEFTNYFVQNKNHTIINRAYCIANPLKHKEYSAQCWGLTASDDQSGYLAHEPISGKDNGTISPTAALSSMPYTPQESLDALKHFYYAKGSKIWGQYGFYDAFNPSKNWYATSYLAIDQGPIVIMIENYKTQLLWNNFMKNEEIMSGLEKIGFSPDTSNDKDERKDVAYEVFPNPVANEITIKTNHPIDVTFFNIDGKEIKSIQNYNGATIEFDHQDGLYLLKIQEGEETYFLSFVKMAK